MNIVSAIIRNFIGFNHAIVDAFVALGGMPTKEGTISKKTLIDIIKTEFELTIDMEVSIEMKFILYRNT